MTDILNGFSGIEFGNPIEEGEQLWKEGKLERLTIYGTSDFLEKLMKHLADENAEELCCMGLDRKIGWRAND